MTVSLAMMDRAFALLEQLAAAGARCPSTSCEALDQHEWLRSAHISALAHAGAARVEISGRNWRQVFILTGHHAGKATAPNPNPERRQPYLIVGTDGARRRAPRTEYGSRRQPSMPKLPWDDEEDPKR